MMTCPCIQSTVIHAMPYRPIVQYCNKIHIVVGQDNTDFKQQLHNKAFYFVDSLWRPFVKQSALCFRTVVLSVLSVYDFGVLWPNGWPDQDETWHNGGRLRLRPRPHCVRLGPSSRQRGHNRQLSAHFSCGQTAGWIKMPLGMEAEGLGPRHIALDGDPVPKKYGTAPSLTFSPCLLWQNGWMNEDATW